MQQAKFSEINELLAVINPAQYSTEQSTTWVHVSNFERIAIVIVAGDIGTSLAADVEIATDSSGTGIHTLKSITTLTQAAGDDNARVLLNVRAEEMVNPALATSSNYDYLRVETTPTGNCIYCVQIWGCAPRQVPVATTLFDEIVG